MMDQDAPPPRPASPRPEEPQHIAAQDARGGEIILRTRKRRAIFIGGLAAWALLAVLVYLIAL